MESAPFFTADLMVLSVWALPQLDFCILRVKKNARLLNQRSEEGIASPSLFGRPQRRGALFGRPQGTLAAAGDSKETVPALGDSSCVVGS